MSSLIRRRTPSRARLRLGRPYQRPRLQLSIRAILTFTLSSSLLIALLRYLLSPSWPVLPLLALVPPFVGCFVLLSVTNGETWKGIVGGLVAAIIANLLYRWDFITLQYWKGRELPSGFWGWGIQLCYVSLAIQFAGFPLIGGCVEAIRKRYVPLGVYALSAIFIYYSALLSAYIWVISRELILPELAR